ncbi:MAG: hypothetical protein R2911_06765 [Caldilineaceae bacterium]
MESRIEKSFWNERDLKLEPIAANPYAFVEAFDNSRAFVGRKKHTSSPKHGATDNFQNVPLYGQRQPGAHIARTRPMWRSKTR